MSCFSLGILRGGGGEGQEGGEVRLFPKVPEQRD